MSEITEFDGARLGRMRKKVSHIVCPYEPNDEYAKKWIFTGEEPTQIVFFVNPFIGVWPTAKFFAVIGVGDRVET